MKVLFVADVHGSQDAHKWIESGGREYSAIIVGGDLERMGSRGYGFGFLTKAASTGLPVMYVPGNADDPRVQLPKGVVGLHGNRSTIGGLSVGGIGGSNPTPFRTPFELKDEDARSLLKRIGRVDILVAHCPPFDTKCDIAGGRHIGSLPVREYIAEHHPRLVLSGHAHDSRAKDTVGETVVANPGPLMDGNFAEIGLEGGIEVELKSSAW